jgi:hypothetical protein
MEEEEAEWAADTDTDTAKGDIANANVNAKNNIGGNTDYPAIYFKVTVLCGRQSRTLLRRYSQFYHLYKQLLNDPPEESVVRVTSTTTINNKNKKSSVSHHHVHHPYPYPYPPLSIPPRTCFFQHVDEEFLNERETDLEFFLKDLLGRPGYIEHPAVQAFLDMPSNDG